MLIWGAVGFLALFDDFLISVVILRFLCFFKVLGRFRALAGCPRGWAPPRINKKTCFCVFLSVRFFGGPVIAQREAWIRNKHDQLYGCECWATTAEIRRKLTSFHNRCARTMIGINMWHVKNQRIKTEVALENWD